MAINNQNKNWIGAATRPAFLAFHISTKAKINVANFVPEATKSAPEKNVKKKYRAFLQERDSPVIKISGFLEAAKSPKKMVSMMHKMHNMEVMDNLAMFTHDHGQFLLELCQFCKLIEKRT